MGHVLLKKNCFQGDQAPVIQSIISLTKLLVGDSLSIAVLIKLTAEIFLAEKL